MGATEDKMKTALSICFAFTICVLIGCKGETTTEPIQTQNLIQNSSFESNGGPSIAGWIHADSSRWTIFPDAPNGGGRYSIVLYPAGRYTFSYNSVITKVAIFSGNHRYNLSCWAKRTSQRAGSIHLFVGSGDLDEMTAVQTIAVTESLWTYYSREMMISSSSNDTVSIALFGGYSPISYPGDSTFFDLCKFEILN